MKKIALIKIVISIFVILCLISCDKNKKKEKNDNGDVVGPVNNPLASFIWEPAGEPDFTPGYTNVNALAVNSDDHIFAGTGGSGIFRSTDHGATWTKTNNGLPEPPVNPYIYALGVNTDDQIFAGTSWTIYRSIDNGNNWEAYGEDAMADRIYGIIVNSEGDLFAAAGASGVYRSSDSGDGWSQVNTGLDECWVESIAMHPSNNDLFIGVSDTEGNSVYRSSNNGDSWTKVGSIESSISTLAVHQDGTIFAGTFDGIFRSMDNGTTWTATNTGFPWEPFVLCLVINENGYLFAGTTDGAFLSTDKGNNWRDISNGLSGYVPVVLSYAIDSNGFIFCGTRFEGIFVSAETTTP